MKSEPHASPCGSAPPPPIIAVHAPGLCFGSCSVCMTYLFEEQLYFQSVKPRELCCWPRAHHHASLFDSGHMITGKKKSQSILQHSKYSLIRRGQDLGYREQHDVNHTRLDADVSIVSPGRCLMPLKKKSLHSKLCSR